MATPIRFVQPITYRPVTVLAYRPTTEITYKPPVVVKSTLSPGESLKPGDSLTSQNQRFQFLFEQSGNLILKDLASIPGLLGAIEWQSATGEPPPVLDTWGKPVTNIFKLKVVGANFVMQQDGNLVLYNPDGIAIWSTMTSNPGAFFVIQDDGNAVLYSGQTALWSAWRRTVTREVDTWFGSVCKTAGRALASVTHAVGEGFTAVGGFLGDIPIIGPLLSGMLLIASGPFTFTESILEGERIDRAILDDLRNKITAIREIAPYVQTILALMPGIGSTLAAAIGTGLALAQGMPIDEALILGLKAAIPGGIAARAAFSITVSVVKGDNIFDSASQAGIDALGLPPEAAKGLHKALVVAYQASQGENIAYAALQQAREYLPTGELRQAFDFAVAVTHGQRLQDALLGEVSNLTEGQIDQIKGVGADVIASSPALQAAKDAIVKGGSETSSWLKTATVTATQVKDTAWGVKDTAVAYGHTAADGYEYGVGLLRHAGVNEQNLQVIRSQLGPEELQGFDMGLAAYRASVTTHLPAEKPAEESAGYLVTKGLEGNPNPQIKVIAVRYFTVNPVAKQGVTYALAASVVGKTPGDARGGAKLTFWGWLLSWVGLK